MKLIIMLSVKTATYKHFKYYMNYYIINAFKLYFMRLNTKAFSQQKPTANKHITHFPSP